MSKVVIGDFCAHIPGSRPGEKGTYKKIGVVFRDSERGNLSVKIDTLPVAGGGWSGWCNVFEESKVPRRPEPGITALSPFNDDEDIPF